MCVAKYSNMGAVVQTAGGWVTKVKVLKGEGCLVRKRDKLFTPEDGELWKKANQYCIWQ